MAGPAVLRIDIVADASKAAASLGRAGDAADKAGDKAQKTSSKWKTLAKGAALAGGAAALGGLVTLFKTGVGEQKDFLEGQAQLANGIKSTGNAAHVSVAGLEKLASSVQDYSGQTDDSIVASEKLLLTFTGIRNEAGKNNDIFDQATKMTADMAAKMGGDASKYAVQLGKALNDPAKGLSKLTKIGVTFTDAQKKQVQQMQKSGDTIGAQKVIMAELRKEFGGSAKAAGDTLPGQMKRAQRSFEDVAQSVVASLMPVLIFLADFLTKTVLPAFQTTIGWMSSHKGIVVAFGIAIGTVYTAIKVGQAATALGEAGGLVAWIKQTQLAAGATRIWAGIQAAFNAIMALNPVVLIVAALVLLGVALVIAYKKSETFRNIVQAAFAGVMVAVRALGAVFSAIFRTVASIMRGAWAVIRTVFGWIISALRVWATIIYAIYVRPWVFAFNVVSGLLRRFASWIPGVFSAVVGAIGRALSRVGGVITGPFQAAWNWIKQRVVAPMRSMFTGLAGAIGHALSGVFDAIIGPFESAWNWIRDHVLGPIKSAWNGVAGAINSIHFSVKVPSFVPGIGGKGWTFDPPNIPTLARGGYVDRATLAVIGERGGEIVAPVAMLRQLMREESGPTIVVNGALDPDAVARQIEQLLTARQRRTRGVTRVGATAVGT